MVQAFDEEFIKKLERLKLAVQRRLRYRRVGEDASQDRGGAEEFIDYRSYTQGDDFKHIDWNIYSRSDSLVVKELTKEKALCVHLLIDVTPSMGLGEQSKYILAKRVAAAIAYIGLACFERVMLYWLTEGGGFDHREFNSKSHLLHILDVLANLQINKKGASLAEALRRKDVSLQPKGVFILLSDLWEDRELKEALELVAAKGHDVSLVHILCDEEMSPPFREKVRLVDVESDRVQSRFVQEDEIAEYQRLLKGHLEGWETFCHAHQLKYCFALSQTPFEEVALVSLRKTGILQ